MDRVLPVVKVTVEWTLEPTAMETVAVKASMACQWVEETMALKLAGWITWEDMAEGREVAILILIKTLTVAVDLISAAKATANSTVGREAMALESSEAMVIRDPHQ